MRYTPQKCSISILESEKDMRFRVINEMLQMEIEWPDQNTNGLIPYENLQHSKAR